MVARGGVEEMCSLLLLVAQEEAERVHRDAQPSSHEAAGAHYYPPSLPGRRLSFSAALSKNFARNVNDPDERRSTPHEHGCTSCNVFPQVVMFSRCWRSNLGLPFANMQSKAYNRGPRLLTSPVAISQRRLIPQKESVTAIQAQACGPSYDGPYPHGLPR